jgi:hypothetical protein
MLSNLIVAMYRLHPTSTLESVKVALMKLCGAKTSASTICKLLKKAGWTHKQVRMSLCRPESEKHVAALRLFVSLYDSEAICVDETCFYVGDHTRMGFAPKGTRLEVRHREGINPRKKLTLLSAMSRDKGFFESIVMDGNCDQHVFAEFLKRLPAGSTVVMDNASFHKTHLVQVVALDRGLVVAHPPPYSPQYNAIELGFSKLKRLFRQKNQETNDTMSAIRDALDGVTAVDSEAFFRHTEQSFIFPARV